MEAKLLALRARPDFRLGADDLPYIIHILRLAEGMPLGILLAAAWARGRALDLDVVVANLLQA